MADVAISNLENIIPVGTSVVPISNGTQTGKASIASLQVDYNNLTNKPTIPTINNAQLAKAWVLFNGGSVISGDGSVSIYSSFNVSKVVRTQQGVYAIYLVTPMADTNYAIAGTVPNTGQFISAGVYSSGTRSTNIIYVSTGMSSSNLTDMNYTSVIVFGN